jgi:hypothetical protein
MESLRILLKLIWEVLIQIPMPWRFLIALIGFFALSSLFILRLLPWFALQTSKILSISVNFLASLLLLPESYISQRIRRRGHEPPAAIYGFGRLVGSVVKIFNVIHQGSDDVFQYLSKKQWLFRKSWFLIVSATFLLMWFGRPMLRNNDAAQFIDKGTNQWYSLEDWVATGSWKTDTKSSPDSFVKGYFLTINQRNYPAAWNSLSTRFQGRRDLMPNGYSNYLDWWRNQVKQVKVDRIKTVSQSKGYALVDVQLRFLKTGNQKVVPDLLRLKLIWDFQYRKWLLDGSERPK